MGTAASTPSARAFVEKTVAENKVVIFSKTYCPFCTKAKNVFAEVGVSPEVVELDTREDGGAVQGALADITGQRTVPNVFVAGTSIGGGDETAAAHRDGTLMERLKSAGVL